MSLGTAASPIVIDDDTPMANSWSTPTHCKIPLHKMIDPDNIQNVFDEVDFFCVPMTVRTRVNSCNPKHTDVMCVVKIPLVSSDRHLYFIQRLLAVNDQISFPETYICEKTKYVIYDRDIGFMTRRVGDLVDGDDKKRAKCFVDNIHDYLSYTQIPWMMTSSDFKRAFGADMHVALPEKMKVQFNLSWMGKMSKKKLYKMKVEKFNPLVPSYCEDLEGPATKKQRVDSNGKENRRKRIMELMETASSMLLHNRPDVRSGKVSRSEVESKMDDLRDKWEDDVAGELFMDMDNGVLTLEVSFKLGERYEIKVKQAVVLTVPGNIADDSSYSNVSSSVRLYGLVDKVEGPLMSQEFQVIDWLPYGPAEKICSGGCVMDEKEATAFYETVRTIQDEWTTFFEEDDGVLLKGLFSTEETLMNFFDNSYT